MFQGGRHRHRHHRDRPPSAILFGLLGLFFSFIVVMVLLSGLLSLIGGAGGLGLMCLAPAAVIGLIAWAISEGRKTGGQGRSGAPYEYDGRLSRETKPAPTSRPITLFEKPAEVAPAQTPARTQTVIPPAAKPAPPAAAPRTIDPYPEKGACKPAEYRQRAASYRRRIQSLIKTRRPGPLATRLNEVLQSLKSWEERVGQLADRLNVYETDDLIRRDIREVPTKIAKLTRLVDLEVDPDMRRQMARTLAAYEEQQRQLDVLARVMRRTRLNLDDTLANMGTIYSQVQVVNAMDVDGVTAERIAGGINSEVDRLNDLLSAMSEVNQQRAMGTTVAPSTPTMSSSTDGTAAEDENGEYNARRGRLQDRGSAG
jgi:hypothetical protein